jgi:hypothetical protein
MKEIIKSVKKKTTENASQPKQNQDEEKNNGGTYFAFSNGRLGRTIPTNKNAVEYQSIDTSGYSKGKKDFILASDSQYGKKSEEKIERKDIPNTINKLKKGATKTVNYK